MNDDTLTSPLDAQERLAEANARIVALEAENMRLIAGRECAGCGRHVTMHEDQQTLVEQLEQARARIAYLEAPGECMSIHKLTAELFDARALAWAVDTHGAYLEIGPPTGPEWTDDGDRLTRVWGAGDDEGGRLTVRIEPEWEGDHMVYGWLLYEHDGDGEREVYRWPTHGWDGDHEWTHPDSGESASLAVAIAEAEAAVAARQEWQAEEGRRIRAGVESPEETP